MYCARASFAQGITEATARTGGGGPTHRLADRTWHPQPTQRRRGRVGGEVDDIEHRDLPAAQRTHDAS